jgi:hypothetical protein
MCHGTAASKDIPFGSVVCLRVLVIACRWRNGRARSIPNSSLDVGVYALCSTLHWNMSFLYAGLLYGNGRCRENTDLCPYRKLEQVSDAGVPMGHPRRFV